MMFEVVKKPESAIVQPDVIQKFIQSLDVTPGSRATYSRSIKPFIVFLAANPKPSREDVLEYKRQMIAAGLSILTVNSRLSAVRRFFEWLESEKVYPNIAKSIKNGRQPIGHLKDALIGEQVQDLLASIDASTEQGARDLAIITLVLYTGVRANEVVRADISDKRQINGEPVLYVQRKGHQAKDGFVLLCAEPLKRINEYLSIRGAVRDTDPLFAAVSNRNRAGRLTTKSISRMAKNYLRGISIDSPRISEHCFRHTAASRAIECGADLIQVQEMMGHGSINTTMIYVKKSNRLKKAAEKNISY